MRKNTFCPSLNDVLEDRLVLSHVGALAVIHAAHAHPTPPTPGHPVLKSAVVNDVNNKIDAAFAQFNREYKREIGQVDRNGDEGKFDVDVAATTARLRALSRSRRADSRREVNLGSGPERQGG